jgi:hypothetical protein
VGGSEWGTCNVWDARATPIVTTPSIAIRRVGARERADWEPLWKGYQF